MQQLNCRVMVRDIRNTIRAEIKELGFDDRYGKIEILLVPKTIGADGLIGGFSDLEDPKEPDFAVYKYTYKLNPKIVAGPTNGPDNTATILIKQRSLILSNGEPKDSDELVEQVYAWCDYMEITVHVSGIGDTVEKLFQNVCDSIAPYFDDENFRVRLS